MSSVSERNQSTFNSESNLLFSYPLCFIQSQSAFFPTSFTSFSLFFGLSIGRSMLGAVE